MVYAICILNWLVGLLCFIFSSLLVWTILAICIASHGDDNSTSCNLDDLLTVGGSSAIPTFSTCSFGQGGKCRDILPKYRVSKGIDTIFLGEISVRRFFGINLEKSAIYSDISAILARNRWFFLDISPDQRSQRATVKVKCATVSPLQCTSPFGVGFSPLAI